MNSCSVFLFCPWANIVWPIVEKYNSNISTENKDIIFPSEVYVGGKEFTIGLQIIALVDV